MDCLIRNRCERLFHSEGKTNRRIQCLQRKAMACLIRNRCERLFHSEGKTNTGGYSVYRGRLWLV